MAGLEIGERGGIRVDEQMRTSNPDIFAVGDAVEVRDFVTGEWTLIPLAGPANRQGRIAAEVIAGRDSRFRGTQGTSVWGLRGHGRPTGTNEKRLVALGQKDFEKVYLFPNSHAGYYPGARTVVLKVIFRKSDGRLLGAQALGQDGVEKRIDALAMAIQMGATVYDLEEAELCYAPPFGSAKDPVNFAGMVPADVLRGDMPLAHWDATNGAFLLDVRNPPELAVERVPGAVNIPLPELRARLGDRPRPGDPRHLPLRPARLLRDAHPVAERLQGPKHLRRHDGPFDAHGHVNEPGAGNRPPSGRKRKRGRFPMTLRRVHSRRSCCRWWSCSPSRATSRAHPAGQGRRTEAVAGRQRAAAAHRWVETTVISMKGEEKSRIQKQCFYGPDGKVQKQQLTAPPEEPAPGGMKGKIVAKKKAEITAAMNEAVTLVQSYVPPDPQRIQAVRTAGNLSISPTGPESSRLDLRSYVKKGDNLSIGLDTARMALQTLSVQSYLDSEKDAVTLDVTFARLRDGLSYPGNVVLNVPGEKIQVVVQNSNYQRVTPAAPTPAAAKPAAAPAPPPRRRPSTP